MFPTERLFKVCQCELCLWKQTHPLRWLLSLLAMTQIVHNTSHHSSDLATNTTAAAARQPTHSTRTNVSFTDRQAKRGLYQNDWVVKTPSYSPCTCTLLYFGDLLTSVTWVLTFDAFYRKANRMKIFSIIEIAKWCFAKDSTLSVASANHNAPSVLIVLTSSLSLRSLCISISLAAFPLFSA